MKTICVGGSSSNSGKTSIVNLLLTAFPGWAAIKVTPCRPNHACPHGVGCGACVPPAESYEIISDLRIIDRPDKDTSGFLDAGASRVLWIRSLPPCVPEALDEALDELSDEPGVIIESTSALPFIDGLKILAVRAGGEMKESAKRCLDDIDFAAWNVEKDKVVPINSVDKISFLLNRVSRIIPMCAMLPIDAPVNRAFIEACRAEVRQNSFHVMMERIKRG